MQESGYIIGIIGLLAASAFFSASETAFTSLNLIRLRNKAESGDRRAEQTLALAKGYDNLLSAILIGNNIVNITAASLATVLFVHLLGDFGVTVSTMVLTILTLVFGEVSPKTLAKEHPERIALMTTPLLKVISSLLKPFTVLFHGLQGLLIRFFGHSSEKTITEEELMTIINEVEEGGNIEADEGNLIRSAILFDDQYVCDITTPRVHVEAVEDDTPLEDVAQVFDQSGFSRLPVYHETIDNIIGVLHIKDLYGAMLRGEKVSLQALVKPVAFIREKMDLARLMETLQQTQSHMAVVTDEYGGTVGIVTFEDIIEELVGDIWDEHDTVLPEVQKQAHNVYLVDGQVEVEALLPRFGIDPTDIEAVTVGGWVTDLLGHIPITGERLQIGDLEVKVEEATPRHVKKLRLTWQANEERGDDHGVSQH